MRKKVSLKKPESRFSTVMLIDDSEMDNFINQKVIEASSFAEQIYVNSNGLSALEFLNNLYIKQNTLEEMLPQVIFVDLNMPIINGFQFIENFKELPSVLTKKCRLVILTSSLNPKDKETAYNLDPSIAFLNKPLTSVALSTII